MPSRREFLQSTVAVACTATGSSPAGMVPHSEIESGKPSSQPPGKRDYRKEPFQRFVAFGASITAGGSATSRELCWVNRVTDAINESQLEPLKTINVGLGASVISPRSAGYDKSTKPSSMERYQKHVVAYSPDLVTISYAVNDARAGTPIGQFLEDLRHIVVDIKSKTGAIIAILSTHFMTDFARDPPFSQANVAVFEGYNCGMKRLSEECDVLYVDVFSNLGFAPWTVDPVDGVHPNNLGHKLIADCVFDVLARNCSCLSQKALELRKTFKQWRNESALQKL
jgi:lysophospholipase L1-like esterase